MSQIGLTNSLCRIAVVLLLMTTIGGTAVVAQDHTGTIAGTIVDDQSSAVPGANVTLENEKTGYSRSMVTDGQGQFRFIGVQPGTYTVRVELTGFSKLELKNRVLSTSSQLNLGDLKLAVGVLTDVITVVADGTTIETENSAPSGLLTDKQIEQISTIGRDVTSLLRLLPGVAYQDDADSLGGEGFASGLPNIGGARQHFNHVTVDGVFANEIGGANNFSMLVNLDAIAEVKVMGSTYQAEYGRGTSQIQITGKQGGSDYRGTAAYYKRHEALNANTWDRNRRDIDGSPEYRFNTFVGSIGGPVPVADKRKLFFFYAGERAMTTNPQGVREWRIPTLKERQGDFSETRRAPTVRRDAATNEITSCTPGTVFVVTDPLTRQPFPGNRIPANRINPSGQALLNVYPEPNLDDPCLAENYRINATRDISKWNHQLRLDYKLSPTASFYLTARNNESEQIGFDTSAGPNARGRWGMYESHYAGDSNSVTLGYSQSLTRRLFSETLVSYRRDTENTFTNEADMQRIQRAAAGYAGGQLYPAVNVDDLLPNTDFRGSNIPARGDDQRAEININNRFPLDGRNWALNLRENLTWVRDRHTFKGGFYFEYLSDNEGSRGGANVGTFSFRHDSNNPFSTGYGYANALLGAFHNYQESSVRRANDGKGAVAEWYVQDTWKASRNLTLDFGVRFQWVPKPWTKGHNEFAVFVPERWDAAQAPVLYEPFRSGTANPPSVTAAVDPRTGQRVGTRFANTYVPGTGNLDNGMVVSGDPTYYSGLRKKQPPLPEPRVGFAYDPSGRGATVVRGGFGLSHQPQLGVGIVTDLLGNPPFGRLENTDFGTFDTLFTANRFFQPGDVRGFDPLMKTPGMYNFSIGVEQSIGRGTVVGVTYVGALGRHLNQNQNLNTIAPGARFLPENLDNGGQPLPDNHLRPYLGHAAANYRSNFGTSNYNGLQTSIVRRHSRGLQFSVAYTWSRSLGISDEDGENIILYRPLREWHYGPHQRSQTHNLQLSYTWDVPKASRLIDNGVVRFLFDNWQISGENAVVSGNWKDVALDRTFTVETRNPDGTISSTSADLDYSGGSHDYRPIMTGNPNKNRGDGVRTPWFDVSVFQRPKPPVPGQPITAENFGNASRRVIRRGGVNNWNLSSFKNFNVGGRRRLQLRWEMYNVLNHTQFDDVGTTAEFKQTPEGEIVQTNSEFGYFTSARDPRRMQGSVRLSF